MDKPSRATFRARLDQMVHQLKQDILSGKLPHGSYLPAEVDLGEQFQLSKKSVRKGLEFLVNDGLIIKKPKVGNMVNAPTLNDKKTIVRFGFYHGVDSELHLQKLIEQFEKKYPNIQIKLVSMFNYKYAEQTIEFMNDGILDVVMLNYQHFNYFVEQNKINLFCEQQVDSDTYPFLNRPFTVNNSLYLRSLSFSPIILCYNKNHLREMNLSEPDSSWKWEEILSTAKALSIKDERNKRYGFFFSALSINRWPLFLLQHNFKLKKDIQGKYILRGEQAFIKGMEQLKEVFSQEDRSVAFFDQTTDPERLFAEERVSMILTSYFRLNYMNTINFEYDISPVPFVENAKTLLVNIGLGVNVRSTHKEESQLFVDYLSSQEGQQVLSQNSMSIPSLKSIAEQQFEQHSQKPSRYSMFKEIMPSYFYCNDMDMEHQLDLMTHYLKLYLSGLESAENIAAMIEDKLNDGSN